MGKKRGVILRSRPEDKCIPRFNPRDSIDLVGALTIHVLNASHLLLMPDLGTTVEKQSLYLKLTRI